MRADTVFACPSFVEGLREIVKAEGIVGLYRGSAIAVTNNMLFR
jgi:hypothetical protein